MTQGLIQGREAFLGRLAAKLGREPKQQVDKPVFDHHPQWEVYKQKSQDDLLAIFKEACQKTQTTVVETTVAALPQTLRDLIRDFGGGPLVATKDSRFETFGLQTMLEEERATIWDPAEGHDNIETGKWANVGLSFSDMALAESGTTVFFHNKQKARSVNLLPTTSIVIVTKDSLVPRLSQATKKIGDRIKQGEKVESYINLISGPSNSADIELNLVIGVHGPTKLGYIIV
ncbi:MAG TPA: lactate utilization protein C [Candidatus Angelobacter sp.]|nr:lactate utilization protein C [Candidatus Angelobacter sp.]